MTDTILFNFKMSKEMNEWLKEVAWQNRTTKSGYLKMLIEKDREKQENSSKK